MPSGKQIESQGPTPLMSHKNLPLLQFYIIWVNHILSQFCKKNIMVWVWNVSHKLLGLSPTPTPQKLVVPVFIGSFVCLVGLVWLFFGGGRQSFPKGTTSWGQRGEPCSWIAGPHFLFMFTSWSANILGNNPRPTAAATSCSGVLSKHGSNKPFLQSVGSCQVCGRVPKGERLKQ